MAHKFSSGFFSGEPAWHGLGRVVRDAPTSAAAIKLAGLDWVVKQTPVLFRNGKEQIEDASPLILNYAEIEGKNVVLGVVSNRYKPVQNQDAFDFIDAILEDYRGNQKPIVFESAGALDNYKIVWLLARINEERKILDDIVEPYLLFSNSHDGKRAVRVFFTNVRVVCNNTLSMALKQAKTQATFTISHTGNVKDKVREAQRILGINKKMHEQFEKVMTQWSMIKITNEIVSKFLTKRFPVNNDQSDLLNERNMERRSIIQKILNDKPDIQNYKDSVYGMYLAMTDFREHYDPYLFKKSYTMKFRESVMQDVISANDVSKDMEMILELAA